MTDSAVCIGLMSKHISQLFTMLYAGTDNILCLTSSNSIHTIATFAFPNQV